MGRIIFNMSGGGTKIFGEAAIAKVLFQKQGFKPTDITGVSAGSYLAVPVAMGLFDEIDKMQNQFNLDTFFDPAPVNDKGNITAGAVIRAATGKYWLGDQRKSLDVLRKIITPERFAEYKSNLAYPDVYVLSVGFRSGANNLVPVRLLSYDEYLDQTLASGSIPLFTKGVETFKWKYDLQDKIYKTNGTDLLFDGGLRNHIASTVLIEDFETAGIKIDRVVSVYTRPKDYKDIKTSDWMPADVSTSVLRSFDILMTEISKSDEELELEYSRRLKFAITQYFLPGDMLEGTYDVDPNRLLAFYKECYRIGIEKPADSTYYENNSSTGIVGN